MDKKKSKVLVAMSGGVDSSTAAKLLVDQGYAVAGVFLRFWKGDQKKRLADSQALSDARRVAKKIGVRFYIFDFSRPFKIRVVNNFLNEYARGRTPNPCIVCNRLVKIGLLLKKARQLGFDYVATGHYVRLKTLKGEPRLYKAKDKNKDQSYFLYTLKYAELKRLLFPLADYTKPAVRTLAAKFKLPVADKAESQDICFLSGAHNNFLKKYLALKPGPIKILGTDKVIGRHAGLPLYTIGQRRGLVGGIGPFYAASFDYRRRILYVVKDWRAESLYKKAFTAVKVNWLLDKTPAKAFRAEAVIRYHHPAVKVRIKPLPGQRAQVEFYRPQRAVTSGQSAVFYQGGRVLGGGVIE